MISLGPSPSKLGALANQLEQPSRGRHAMGDRAFTAEELPEVVLMCTRADGQQVVREIAVDGLGAIGRWRC